ncbi:MAG: GNAT family N-acetyltransferase [Polyangiaceae bacterium]|nr:GNAT family N-acetyltransferase [Polyangiaceae bacterium]
MNCTSRAARPDDYASFLSLVPELGTSDPIPDRERWERLMMPGTRIFEEAGSVAAYTWCTPLEDVGYVRHVVVHPGYRGKGIGRLAMADAAALFRAAGCSRWVLNVKPDNEPALRLYRSVGMTERYLSTALRMEWSAVDTLPAPPPNVVARPADATEDAALEAAFGLPKKTLSNARSAAGRIILRLEDLNDAANHRVGVASFDPGFPGSFPFRVAHPSYARALFEAMKPHARPEFSHIGAVVEDDAALTQSLLDHGAETRLRIVHFEGHL